MLTQCKKACIIYEYEIIIPTYDIEKFNNLLNLKIEEN